MRRALGIRAALAVAALVACGSDDERSAATPRMSTPESTAPATTLVSPSADGLALRYGSVKERTIDVGADGRNTTAAVAGMNAFALDLFKKVAADQTGNVVLSPYNVTFALGMIYAGGNGQTAKEMASVLHADIRADRWHEGINAYDLTLDARTAGSPTSWSAANKVWTQLGVPLRDQYLDVLTGAYGSPLAEADFATDVDAQREVINRWVAEQTTDRITELFPPESLDPKTAMVLVNAVALDAPWEFPFDPAATADEPFIRPTPPPSTFR